MPVQHERSLALLAIMHVHHMKKPRFLICLSLSDILILTILRLKVNIAMEKIPFIYRQRNAKKEEKLCKLTKNEILSFF